MRNILKLTVLQLFFPILSTANVVISTVETGSNPSSMIIDEQYHITYVAAGDRLYAINQTNSINEVAKTKGNLSSIASHTPGQLLMLSGNEPCFSVFYTSKYNFLDDITAYCDFDVPPRDLFASNHTTYFFTNTQDLPNVHMGKDSATPLSPIIPPRASGNLLMTAGNFSDTGVFYAFYTNVYDNIDIRKIIPPTNGQGLITTYGINITNSPQGTTTQLLTTHPIVINEETASDDEKTNIYFLVYNQTNSSQTSAISLMELDASNVYSNKAIELNYEGFANSQANKVPGSKYLAFNPHSKRLYFIDVDRQGTDNKYYLVEYDIQSQAAKRILLEHSSIEGAETLALAINEKTNKLFITMDNSTLVIVSLEDMHNASFISLLPEKNPATMAINKQLNKLYIANHDSKSVSIVDGIE